MAGVTVSIVDAALPPSARVPSPGTYFVVVQADRGPTAKPEVVRSLAEFEAVFGGRQSYSHAYDDLATFFGEGGGRAIVTRVVGPAAVLATVAIVSLTFTAKNAGAWANSVAVQIVAGSLSGVKILVADGGVIKESYDNIATVDDAVAACTGSGLVTVTKTGAVAPVVTASTPLIGGTDDRASIVAATYQTALAQFGKTFGPGCVAIPGQASSTVGQYLIDHADAFRRLAILTTGLASAKTPTEAAAVAMAQPKGKQALLAWPWIKVRDSAGERIIPPCGYVAAARARVIAQYGAPGAPGAGEIAVARTLSGLETELALDSDYDFMANKGVSVIRTRQSSIRVYGWQSLSADRANYRLAHVADMVNFCAWAVEAILEPFVFRPIDGRGVLYAEISSVVTGVLSTYAKAGLLFARTDPNTGAVIDPGFRIEVAAVNTPATLANNELRVRIGVRPSPAAEIITVEIVRLPVQV